MEYAKQFVYGAMPLRLSLGQWAVVAGVLAIVLCGWPRLTSPAVSVPPAGTARIPYEFSSDYWFCERWFAAAARDHEVLLLGDSVVWGEYVTPSETLAARLNQLTGTAAFANLGVNGMHPAALHGLLRYHGGAVREHCVIVVLNTLWMSSPRLDLRRVPGAAEDDRGDGINHPALLPQFWPRVGGVGAPFETRAGVVLERSLPGLAWISHLRTKGAWYSAHLATTADGSDAVEGMPLIEVPRPHPFAGFRVPVPAAEDAPHSQPEVWTERGLAATSIPWPAAAESVQWRYFRETVELLRRRGNRVLVWVSPFNPYVQTAASQAAHAAMVREMVGWLEANQVPVVCAAPLPSAEYADASHPLAVGYTRLAEEWLAADVYRAWRSR